MKADFIPQLDDEDDTSNVDKNTEVELLESQTNDDASIYLDTVGKLYKLYWSLP